LRLSTRIARWLLKRQAIWREVGVLGGRQYGGGIAPSADMTELLAAYQGWIYSCANIISRNVHKVPLRLYQKQGDEWIELEEHVLIDLLDYPNPIYTRVEVWELTVVWLELTGNAYWYTPKNRLGVPAEIWPIPPDRMVVVPDPNELIKGYLYRYQGKEIAFSRDEIIHLRYPNPQSVYYGMGPLQAAAYGYDLDLYMKQYSVNLFKNDGRPTGVLKTDQVLDEGTINRIRAAWNRLHQGVDKAGKLAILQAGTKYERIQISPAELDYLASRRATRDEILGIFGVPASKLGLVEDVNRANAEANDYTFQSEVIHPRLKLIEAKLNKDLVPQFDENLWFEYDSPVPEDRDFLLRERETNLKNFITSVNEERARIGMDDAPWGDAPWMPFSLVQAPVGSQMAGVPYEAVEQQFSSAAQIQARTQKDRDIQWRRFLALHVPLAESFRHDLRKLFRQQRKEVLANLEKALKTVRSLRYDPALVDFILFSMQEWQEKFAEMADPKIRSFLAAGVEKALADLAAGDFEFDFRNPRVTAFIQARKQRFSFEVNQSTLQKLKAELVAGLEAGETMDLLAVRVNKVFDFAETWRALRIARTETTISLNTGVHEAYNQTGIVKKQMWLSARDEKVRSSHIAMDGITVPLDGKFETMSGDLLRYPGDPQGSAAEIINCRCTLLPVTE